MKKTPVLFVLLLCCVIPDICIAQEDADTFFLARKKGILGKIGRSISTEANEVMPPMKTVNPFMRFAGKTIGSIQIKSIGLDRKVDDSTVISKTFIENVADAFHKNTRERVIRRNLFLNPATNLFHFSFRIMSVF